MTKIDFSKVEQNLGEAMHHFFVKKLIQGEFIGSARLISYFGQQRSKPAPQDSVIQCLIDIQLEEEQERTGEQEGQEAKEMPENPSEELIAPPEPEVQMNLQEILFIPLPEEPMIVDESRPPISPIVILRNRIRWFIRKHVVGIYQLLGTTKEEVSALRRKAVLSETEEARVKELIVKSTELHALLNKKLGAEDNEALIAAEKKKHLTKRFNVRESWLPL